ncbi:alpha/beta hydrolase [Solimonas terrae]|uniref:Alpha/beta hydrolase n=1 Tax=Solimonas terrae TaxID=1396819 RepID=A0A6M2BP23_9GAMM|nr:hypothetical protein [Solimonas terrae]NGY04114.1 hypothetical protein [Solimonas terrae]
MRLRLPGIKPAALPARNEAQSLRVTVALPASYEKARRRRYPLIVLTDARELFGSAVEMCRAVAAARETRECIIVRHDEAWLAPEDAAAEAAHLEQIIAWCRRAYRVQRGEVALFVSGGGVPCARTLHDRRSKAVDRWIVVAQTPSDTPSAWCQPPARRAGRRPRVAWTGTASVPVAFDASVSVKTLPEATPAGQVVTALLHGLRALWGTGHDYGSEVMPLGKPLVAALLRGAMPIIRRLRQSAKAPPANESRYRFRSELMDRDFEIFVSLPPRARERRQAYPAVVTLDGSATWSTCSEIALRMAAAGEIEDVVMIGIGVPHEEGEAAFGLRRFEEFSPPAGDAAFTGGLGRIFESIFALFGQDVRRHFGRAPDFHRFIVDELMPELLRVLPLDPQRLCIAGHSAGGTFIGFERAQADSPFSRFAVSSPGVSISDNWMLKADGGLRPGLARGRRTIVTMGGEERHNAFNALAGIPLSAHYARQLEVLDAGEVEFLCLDGDSHTTVFPRAFALAMSRLFASEVRGA